MSYITKLNSFDEVAQWYAKIKPLRSKNHTLEQDVRPLGNRARKWERIVRIDPNTYVLTHGGHADPVFSWGGLDEMRQAFPLTTEETVRLSPIVWRKHTDGTETVTLRNGAGAWSHNSTYSFLAAAIPRELWFRQTTEGKQFIYNRCQGHTVYLPKTKSVPRYVYEYHKENAKNKNSGYWSERVLKAFISTDDGLSVTFKRGENGHFTLVGEAPKVMVDRVRMNKELKGSFKAEIAGLLTNATALFPLMRSQLGYTLRNNIILELSDVAKALNLQDLLGSRHGALFGAAKPELIQAILRDPEHPMQHGLTMATIFEIAVAISNFDSRSDYYEDTEGEDKARNTAIRAHFNRWISKLGGFTVTTQEEK